MRSRLCFAAVMVALLQTGCATHSQFIYPSFTPLPPNISGPTALPDPTHKILLIYNHGSQPESKSDYCYPNSWTTPNVIKDLSGQHIGKYEVAVYAYCSPWQGGEYNHVQRTGELKVIKRSRSIEQLVRDFQVAGVPSEQIFLVGHSAGAWASLLAARRGEVKFNAVIGFAPAFAGEEAARPGGWRILRERQVRYLSEASQIPALIYAFEGDSFNEPDDLAFLTQIPGIELVALASNEIDGKKCRFANGHRTAFKACFRQTHRSQILAFIKQRLQLESDD